MLFNSFEFLIFFPVVTIVYFLLFQKHRWWWLLFASCVFYMFFIPKYIFILFVTIIIDYIAGILIENSTGKKRIFFLVFSVISTIIVLAIFKYFNFLSTNLTLLSNLFGWNYRFVLLDIILPIGLSFHTFQSLSYVIEVYRGRQKAERNFGVYSLYVMFYPQLVAGPIERPQNILHQFYECHKPDYKQISTGLKLMAWGFFKKLVIADRLAPIVDKVYDAPGQHSSLTLIFVTLLFAQQIYCDFSGYSDIAIGAARVMGFKLMTNFNTPYISRSVSEFWKRWHISLSTWFRDYVYIELGGNRVSKFRWYINLMITFLLSGLWHGASWTFIIWGGLNGLYLVFEAATQKFREKVRNSIGVKKHSYLFNFVTTAVTVIVISFAWIFFRANTLNDAIIIIKGIFYPMHFKDNYLFYVLGINYNVIVGVIALMILEFIQRYKLEIVAFLKPRFYLRWSVYILFLIALLNFGIFTSKGFIYFQF